MKEALFYVRDEEHSITCQLCPHHCRIEPGMAGLCGVRKHIDGILHVSNYGGIEQLSIGPVENNLLYHYLPGSSTLSIGSFGCTFQCDFCQNMYQNRMGESTGSCVMYTPLQIVQLALQSGCESIAYTYGEPVVHYEFVRETSEKAHQHGIRNIMVTNGYIEDGPASELFSYMDAVIINLRGFTREVYVKKCKASLEPVLNTIYRLRSMSVWMEIVSSIVSGINDTSAEIFEMCHWLKHYLGTDCPIHFRAFQTSDNANYLISASLATLLRAREVANGLGFPYIYLDNMGEKNYTRCAYCDNVLLVRNGSSLLEKELEYNACQCGKQLPGVWS